MNAELGDEQDVWLRIEELAVELARTVESLRAEIGRRRGEESGHGDGQRD